MGLTTEGLSNANFCNRLHSADDVATPTLYIVRYIAGVLLLIKGSLVEGQSNDPVRAFTRVFIAVPGSDGGLLLVNDEQFIRNATTEEIRKAFATPAPTPSSSPVPVLATVPQDLVQAFSLFSSMNSEWSQKCLQDNGWDFEQAAQIFMKLKAEGKIPEIAFIN
ncbi:unnamed protein product [Ranitomeya imitator]|uniref:Nuclear RNA export factor 1 n=1 Tax=Ranitomeya imitator TaxID=111125 RepID=A0ABN9LCB6_9NEOB|nr:unnamed protein product [Ranitomeya imitator]